MKKLLCVMIMVVAVAVIFPRMVAGQEQIDFTPSTPVIQFNGMDYFLTVPEFGFAGQRWGVQWKLNEMDGFWEPGEGWEVFNQAFVVGSLGGETGYVSTFSLSTLATENRIGETHNDVVAMSANGRIYVINRSGQSNITVYTPGFPTAQQFSVAVDGDNTDPHSLVLISSTKAYVILYNKPYILIINPQTGQHLGRIELSGWFSDPDRIPEAEQAILVNGKIYVILQVLDRDNWWSPTGNSSLVRINPVTDAVEDVTTLLIQNPLTLQYHVGRKQILVGGSGTWTSITDGGIEAINPETLNSEGVLVSESALGGNLGDFAMADASKGYAVVFYESGDRLVPRLVSFNLNTGQKLADVLVSNSDYMSDVAVHKGRVYLCDTMWKGTSGVWVFDALTDRILTSEPIDVGMWPYSITFY